MNSLEFAKLPTKFEFSKTAPTRPTWGAQKVRLITARDAAFCTDRGPHAAEADPAGGPIVRGVVSNLSRPGAEKHTTLLTSPANYTRISLIPNLAGGTKSQ